MNLDGVHEKTVIAAGSYLILELRGIRPLALLAIT